MARPTKPEKPVAKYLLGQQSSLQYLCDKALMLQQLYAYIAPSLPLNWREQCFVVNCTATSITLATHNASLGTHLKYAAPTILADIRRRPGLQHIERVACRVLPIDPTLNQPEDPPPHPVLSAESRAVIKEFAASLDDAPSSPTNELKAVLERLVGLGQ